MVRIMYTPEHFAGEPFTEEVMLPVVSNSSVTVTAVNCLGQRAQVISCKVSYKTCQLCLHEIDSFPPNITQWLV